jgi:hypothetical protein
MTATLRPSLGTLGSGGWTNLNFTASPFNSLASGSGVKANTIFTNTNLDLYAEVSFSCINGATALSNNAFWTLYWLPLNQDGSTFGDGSNTVYGTGASAVANTPSSAYYLRNFTLPSSPGNIAAGGTMVGRCAPFNLPTDSGYFFIQNNTGQTTNSTASFVAQIRTTNLNMNG